MAVPYWTCDSIVFAFQFSLSVSISSPSLSPLFSSSYLIIEFFLWSKWEHRPRVTAGLPGDSSQSFDSDLLEPGSRVRWRPDDPTCWYFLYL